MPNCFVSTIVKHPVGITSYYCVILKIVTLYDGMKTMQNGVFLFSLKKEQNLVSFKKNKKTFFKKPKITQVFFFCFEKKTGFSQPWLELVKPSQKMWRVFCSLQ